MSLVLLTNLGILLSCFEIWKVVDATTKNIFSYVNLILILFRENLLINNALNNHRCNFRFHLCVFAYKH